MVGAGLTGKGKAMNRIMGAAVAVTVLGVLGAWLVSGSSGPQPDDRVQVAASVADKYAAVPPCEHEDGSTQEVCWWYDSANGLFINMDYGKYTYATAMGDVIDTGR